MEYVNRKWRLHSAARWLLLLMFMALLPIVLAAKPAAATNNSPLAAYRPSTLPEIIAAGERHTCALKTDGSVD